MTTRIRASPSPNTEAGNKLQFSQGEEHTGKPKHLQDSTQATDATMYVTEASKISLSLKPTQVSSPPTGKAEVLSPESCYNVDQTGKPNHATMWTNLPRKRNQTQRPHIL